MRGAMLFISALLLFACMDTSIKYLTASYDVPVIVAVRYTVNLLLIVLIFAPTQPRQMVTTNRTALVVVRGMSLATMSLLMGLALQRMPVAETTAINFLAPIVVVLVAGPLLGESIGPVGWIAALMGFAGVLLIVRPGSGLEPLGVACALGGTAAGTVYQLLSRVLVSTERTVALQFYTALVGTIAFGIAAPWFWNGRVPTALEASLFLVVGVSGGLGHYMITAAYRHAPVSLLAPMNYLQLVWAALLGWLIFRHLPDRLGLLGMGIVAASGLIVALKSRRPPVKRAV